MAYRPQYKNKNGNIVDLPLDAETVRGKEVYSKDETDTRIAEKLDEKQITEVNCSHEVEITGFGEEDCNLVIDDQDVVITKIQGQTRRKSLNLFNSDTKYSVENAYNMSYSFSNGNLTATISGLQWVNLEGYLLDLIPNQTYTISAYIEKNGVANGVGFRHSDEASEIALLTGTNEGFISLTFTPTESTYFLQFYFSYGSSNAGTISFKNIMLNEGSTALPYEPYDNTLVNSKCDFVSTGRNLLDFSTIEKSGWYGRFANVTLVKGQTYTVDYGYNVTHGSNLIFNNIELFEWSNNFRTKTFTYNGDTKTDYLYVCYPNENLDITTLSKMMLYVGDTALPYEPYVDDTMKCSIELGAFDYNDNINHITHRQTSEMITLNGSESDWVSTPTSTSGKYRFAKPLQTGTGILNGDEIGISSNWIDLSTNKTYACNNGISVDSKSVIVYVEGITTFDELKTWLQANPITFVYKLATETTEENTLPSGYKVWYKGLQVQNTETLPYILTKQYAISLASQVLNNVSVDRSQQKQIDELKENKANASDVYTKTETYSKIETNALLNEKYDVASFIVEQDIYNIKTFLDYLNDIDTNITISDFLGRVIVFNCGIEDAYTFTIIPTFYDNEGVLICNDGIYRLYMLDTTYYADKYAYFDDITAITGSLSNLETTNKTNLVSAINEVKNTQPHLYRHQISFSESALSQVSFEINLAYPTAINTKDKIKAILTDNYYTSIQRPKDAIGMSLGQGYIFDAIYINNGELFARELTTPSTSISIEGLCVSIEDKITQIF